MRDKMMETALLKVPVHSAGICRLVWGLDITFNYCPWVLKSHVSEEIQPEGSPGSSCCRWGCRSYQGQSWGSQRTKWMEIGLWRILGLHRLLRLLKMYSRVTQSGGGDTFAEQESIDLSPGRRDIYSGKKPVCWLRKDLAWERQAILCSL